jgi:predicted permease
VILENIVLVMGLIGLGSVSKRSGIFPENTPEVLNKFILNISLPAIIIISIPSLVFDSNMLLPVAIHWGAFLFHVAILYFVCKILKFSGSVFGALLIVTTLGNTAFLGIPMINTFLGVQAVPYAVLYDQLGSGIGYIILGAFVLPRFVGKKVGNPKEVFIGLLKFPPFVALVLGFVFMNIQMPKVLENYLSSISSTLIPCAMIAVGFQMKYRLPRSTLYPMGVGLFIKLLIIPFVTLLVVTLVAGDSLAAKTSILQSGMPPMITAGAMVMAEKLEVDLCTSLVGYGLFFSFLTLSLVNIFL